MKRYQDLTIEEKLVLTLEEIERYIAIELMINGVEVPEVPDLPRKASNKIDIQPNVTCYKVGDIYFKTEKDADAFLDSNPFKSDYSSSFGYNYKYLAPHDRKVERIELYDEQELKDRADELKDLESQRQEIEKVWERYDALVEKVNHVRNRIKDDYHFHLNRRYEAEKIKLRYQDYLSLANQDPVIAMNFLCKLCDETDIADAEKYLGAGTPWPSDQPIAWRENDE